MVAESVLEVNDLQASADCDVLTIHKSSGTIEGSTFECQSDTLPSSSRRMRYLWGVAVQDQTGAPVRLVDCIFEGGELGLDLDHAWWVVEGCSFRNITRLGVWDHLSPDRSHWDLIDEGSSFDGCSGNLYLGTMHTATYWISLSEPSRELGITHVSIDYDFDLFSPIQEVLVYFDMETDDAALQVPTVLVDGADRISETLEPKLRFKYSGMDWEVPTNIGAIDVDVLPLEPPWWEAIEAPVSLESLEANASRGPGSYEFNISVSDEHLYAVNNTFSLYLDGVLLEEKGLYEDSLWLDTFSVSHALNWTFEPGFHVLDVVVEGYARIDEHNVSEVQEEIENVTFTFRVLTGDHTEVEPWALIEADQVLVWPGIDASVSPVVPRNGAWKDLSINLHGGNGSTLLIDCSGLPPDADLHISPGAGPSVTIVNASIHELFVFDEEWWIQEPPENVTVSISNVTCEDLFVTPARHGLLEDVHTSGTLYLSQIRSGDATVHNCTFGGYGAYLYVHDGDISVSDCTVGSDSPASLTVVASGIANANVSSVRFSNASLLVYRSAFYWTFPTDVTVTDCTFSGSDCHMFVGADLTQMDFYDADPWSVPAIEGTVAGNVFEGTGSTVTMHHGLFTRLWGDNDLDGNVRLYAYYLTRLMVIPPHGLPPKPGYYMVIDGQDYVQGLPFGIYRWMVPDGELCLDVTDDPTREENPSSVRVLLSSSPYFRDLVVTGFSTLDPDADNGETMYDAPPDWPDVLEDHVKGWPWGQKSLKD